LSKIDLSVEIAGIRLRNPVLTAAGPASRDGHALRKAAEGGAGGLVAKTISVFPAAVPRPCVSTADRNRINMAVLNCETWSDIPYQRWIKSEYKIAKKTGLPVIASIGYNADDLKKLGPLVEKTGVDGIEFSLHYVGIDYKPILEIAKTLREFVEVPIFSKLSPHILNLAEFSKELEKAGVDGIVAVNSYGPALHIDIETKRPLLGGESGYGWLSGPAIKPLAIRFVAEIARSVRIPVIGCGGVVKGTDAVEYLMAGASAVQICTGAILKGPKIYGQVANEIKKFMIDHDYNSIEEIRGISMKYLKKESIIKTAPPSTKDELCIGCHLCERSCVYDAIRIEEAQPKKFNVLIDKNKCYRCGMCISICPTRAVLFE
jgi:dihydropyrimidine dehydrogenase (NAD+) subunit PreA